MRIAPHVALALAACGSTPPPPAEPPLPACGTAYDAIVASLTDLHAHAGRPVPPLPDRAAWISACDRLTLTDDQLRCLEPARAAADAAGCATRLAGVDRAPLDQPFLDTMLAPGGTP